MTRADRSGWWSHVSSSEFRGWGSSPGFRTGRYQVKVQLIEPTRPIHATHLRLTLCKYYSIFYFTCYHNLPDIQNKRADRTTNFSRPADGELGLNENGLFPKWTVLIESGLSTRTPQSSYNLDQNFGKWFTERGLVCGNPELLNCRIRKIELKIEFIHC